MFSRPLVLLIVSFLLVMLIYSSASIRSVSAQTYTNGFQPVWPGGDNPSPTVSCHTGNWYVVGNSSLYSDITCTWYDSNGYQWSQTCTYDAITGNYHGFPTGGGFTGCSFKAPGPIVVHGRLFNNTNGATQLTNALPPSAGLLKGRIPTSALNASNATSASPTMPPVSIIKLPPGSTTAGPTTPTPNNSTGPTTGGTTAIKIPPAGTTSLTGTATNPSNGPSTARCLPGQGGPGCTITIPPGAIYAPPSGTTTGNPAAVMSSDNPPGCSKKIPIPPNCTINPFPTSGATSAQVPPGLFKPTGNITNAPVTPKNSTVVAERPQTLSFKLGRFVISNSLPSGNKTVNAANPGNNTLPPGSIFKVPPGTTITQPIRPGCGPGTDNSTCGATNSNPSQPPAAAPIGPPSNNAPSNNTTGH